MVMRSGENGAGWRCTVRKPLGFPYMIYPNKWMVYFMENPPNNWMMPKVTTPMTWESSFFTINGVTRNQLCCQIQLLSCFQLNKNGEWQVQSEFGHCSRAGGVMHRAEKALGKLRKSSADWSFK